MSSLNMNTTIQPVLIAGILFGILTAIPPFNFINVCTCCSLFAAAGFVAGWLYRRSSGNYLTPGSGALLGALTGVVGGTTHSAISFPIAMILEKVGGGQRENIAERLSEILGEKNAEAAEIVRRFLENSEGMGFLFLLIKLISDILFFSLFALLGGILYAAIFKNRNVPSMPAANASTSPIPTPDPMMPPPPIHIPPPIPVEHQATSRLDEGPDSSENTREDNPQAEQKKDGN